MYQTILISGAGSGIGRALAQQFAKDGHRLVLLGRTLSSLEETRVGLPGDGHLLVIADIREAASIGKGLEEAGVELLHGVIANAGVGAWCS